MTVDKEISSVLKKKRAQKESCKQRKKKREISETQAKNLEVILLYMPEDKREEIRKAFNDLDISGSQFEDLVFLQ